MRDRIELLITKGEIKQRYDPRVARSMLQLLRPVCLLFLPCYCGFPFFPCRYGLAVGTENETPSSFPTLLIVSEVKSLLLDPPAPPPEGISRVVYMRKMDKDGAASDDESKQQCVELWIHHWQWCGDLQERGSLKTGFEKEKEEEEGEQEEEEEDDDDGETRRFSYIGVWVVAPGT